MGKRINQIKNLFHIGSLLNKQQVYINSSFERERVFLRYEQRKNYLTSMTLHSNESGICNEKYGEHELIVTMSTHGIRFHEAYLAIESLMQQSLKPNKIILNVAKEEASALYPAIRSLPAAITSTRNLSLPSSAVSVPSRTCAIS